MSLIAYRTVLLRSIAGGTMLNDTYQLLKAEIPSIAEAVKLFPEELQSEVFHIMVSSLVGKPVEDLIPPENKTLPTTLTPDSSPPPPINEQRNYVEEFKKFVEEKDPDKKLLDLEFAALVSYFFTYLAPPNKQTENITPEMLLDANKKPPKNPKSTLMNAKAKRGFLETGNVAGSFKLSPAGEYFVKNELPKKSK
jgi:hypothetical protein